MNALELVDETLNAGYTAPRLADNATANHLLLQKSTAELRARLGQLGVRCVLKTGQSSLDKGGELLGVDGHLFQDIPKGPASIRLKFKSGNFEALFFLENWYTENRHVKFSEYISLNTLRSMSEDLWVPLLKGETVSLPVTDIPECAPLEELSVLCFAPGVREILFNTLREVYGTINLRTDIMTISSRRETDTADLNKFASLFVTDRKLKATGGYAERAEAIRSPLSDLGIKNMDYLAIVIFCAAEVFRMSAHWKSRAILSGFPGYMKDVLRDASYILESPVLAQRPPGEWSVDLLCRLIEHFGGTVPKTVCFRR